MSIFASFQKLQAEQLGRLENVENDIQPYGTPYRDARYRGRGDVEELWLREAEQRYEAYRQGLLKPRLASQVFEEAREKRCQEPMALP